jgi:hypothetical protein
VQPAGPQDPSKPSMLLLQMAEASAHANSDNENSWWCLFTWSRSHILWQCHATHHHIHKFSADIGPHPNTPTQPILILYSDMQWGVQ